MVLDRINQNECAGPVRSEFGYHLLWVEAVKAGGEPDIQKHWNEIEVLALNKKQGYWFSSWVKESRKKLFINILN
jgi:parvulin-like peptidyl-prolyl isomerase